MRFVVVSAGARRRRTGCRCAASGGSGAMSFLSLFFLVGSEKRGGGDVSVPPPLLLLTIFSSAHVQSCRAREVGIKPSQRHGTLRPIRSPLRRKDFPPVDIVFSKKNSAQWPRMR